MAAMLFVEELLL